MLSPLSAERFLRLLGVRFGCGIVLQRYAESVILRYGHRKKELQLILCKSTTAHCNAIYNIRCKYRKYG